MANEIPRGSVTREADVTASVVAQTRSIATRGIRLYTAIRSFGSALKSKRALAHARQRTASVLVVSKCVAVAFWRNRDSLREEWWACFGGRSVVRLCGVVAVGRRLSGAAACRAGSPLGA
jgi:hypothetical protein